MDTIHQENYADGASFSNLVADKESFGQRPRGRMFLNMFNKHVIYRRLKHNGEASLTRRKR